MAARTRRTANQPQKLLKPLPARAVLTATVFVTVTVFVTAAVLVTAAAFVTVVTAPVEAKGLAGMSKSARLLLIQELTAAKKEAEKANEQMQTDMEALAKQLPALFSCRDARNALVPPEATLKRLEDIAGPNPYDTPHLSGELARHRQEHPTASPSRLLFIEGQTININPLQPEISATGGSKVPGTINIGIDWQGHFLLWGTDLDGQPIMQSGKAFTRTGMLRP